MSEETPVQPNPAGDSIKSSVVVEEEKQGSSTDVAATKEPTIIIPPGFRGLFSLKSKNMSAKERFN